METVAEASARPYLSRQTRWVKLSLLITIWPLSCALHAQLPSYEGEEARTYSKSSSYGPRFISNIDGDQLSSVSIWGHEWPGQGKSLIKQEFKGAQGTRHRLPEMLSFEWRMSRMVAFECHNHSNPNQSKHNLAPNSIHATCHLHSHTSIDTSHAEWTTHQANVWFEIEFLLFDCFVVVRKVPSWTIAFAACSPCTGNQFALASRAQWV